MSQTHRQTERQKKLPQQNYTLHIDARYKQAQHRECPVHGSVAEKICNESNITKLSVFDMIFIKL